MEAPTTIQGWYVPPLFTILPSRPFQHQIKGPVQTRINVRFQGRSSGIQQASSFYNKGKLANSQRRKRTSPSPPPLKLPLTKETKPYSNPFIFHPAAPCTPQARLLVREHTWNTQMTTRIQTIQNQTSPLKSQPNHFHIFKTSHLYTYLINFNERFALDTSQSNYNPAVKTSKGKTTPPTEIPREEDPANEIILVLNIPLVIYHLLSSFWNRF